MNKNYQYLVDYFKSRNITSEESAITLDGIKLPKGKTPENLDEMVGLLSEFVRTSDNKYYYDPENSKIKIDGTTKFIIILLFLGVLLSIVFRAILNL